MGVLLWATKYFVRLATHEKPVFSYIQKGIPWMQVLVWSFFVFWVVHYLFLTTTLYSVLISALILIFLVFVSWYVLRDLFAGVVIRSGQSLEPGITITAGSFSGTISRLGYFSLYLITPDGKRTRIPYHRLSGEIISWRSESGEGKNQIIKLILPQYLGVTKIKRELTGKLLQLPWVVAGADIKFQMIPMGDSYETEISFYSIREDMVARTAEVARMHIENLIAQSNPRQKESQ